MPKWLVQSKSSHQAPVPRGRNLQPEANKGRKHVSIARNLSPRRASRKTRRSTDVFHCIGPNLPAHSASPFSAGCPESQTLGKSNRDTVWFCHVICDGSNGPLMA